MESSASLSFFVSVRFLHHPITDWHRRKSPPPRNSRLDTRTAPRLVASQGLKGGKFTSHSSSRGFIAAASVIIRDPVSCSLDVSSCIERKISGYWVGPDIDDGWGFIEASIEWKF